MDLENALAGLLAPDSDRIRLAEQQLKEPFRNPAIIEALAQLVSGSQSPQIRQLSSVLLRRLAIKHWENVTADTKQLVRAALLTSLAQETEHSVSFNISEVVGEIADLELSTESGWPGLWEFLQAALASPEGLQQELGLMLLCSLSESAGDKLAEQFSVFSHLFPLCLSSESVKPPYYALKALASLAPYVSHLQEAYFRDIVPLCLSAIDRLLAVDEDKALEGMDVITELIESEGNTIGSHLQTLLAFILRIGAAQDRDKAPRCKALSLLLDLILTKKGKFLKGDNFLQVIRTLFTIMASPMDEMDEEDEEDGTDLLLGYTPQAVASQVMGNLAIEFTHDMIINPLMEIIRENHASVDENVRRACLVAITVVADGCSVHLKLNHLAPLMQLVDAGFADSSRTVFLAALTAISEFAVHFQPDISKFSADILTKLLVMLVNVLEATEFDKTKTKHVFHAFEMVIENSEEDVSAFLQQTMEILLTVLSKTTNGDVRELAIQSLGAVATAVKKDISPYFGQMMDAIKPHLIAPAQDEEPSVILLTCIDTLGVLARNVDVSAFQPLALDCINLGLQLIAASSDPDLRSVVYGLLAAICVSCPDIFRDFLPTIIPLMWASLRESEAEKTDESFAFSGLNGGGGDDDSDGIEGVNSPLYVLKEDAANSLAQISEVMLSSFEPYFDESFTLIVQLLEDAFLPSNAERASVSSMGRICVSFKKHVVSVGSTDVGTQQLSIYVAMTIARCAELAKTTYNRLSAVAALEALKDLCNELETEALPSDEHFVAIFDTVNEFLNLKATCQQSNLEEEDGVEEKGTEYDHLVVETAGEILPCLAVAKGPEQFLPYFTTILPSILSRTSKSCTDAERSFGYGIVAEILKELGSAGEGLGSHLLPVLINGCSDTDDEVANNAIFGVGIIAQYGGPEVKANFMAILQILSAALEQRKAERRVMDNICSCVCRVLMAGVDTLPVSMILATLLPHLPLQLDFEENHNVYVACLCRLIEVNHPAVAEHRPTLILLFTALLSDVERFSLSEGTPPLSEVLCLGLQQLQQQA